MEQEKNYAANVRHEHLKAWGQFFTPHKIAEFMCRWAGKNAQNMLDPAAGNSIFLQQMTHLYPQCQLTGYELDSEILNFFGNPSKANMIAGDYLAMDWNKKYESIVCNPPYNKFQAIDNRSDIFKRIFNETGIRYNGNCNLYLLFLIKSIHQLAPQGKLAYIVPSEFLNSIYGTQIKAILLKEKILHSIINFRHNEEIFPGANTTCCIILLERSEKAFVYFYNLNSMDELAAIDVEHGIGPHNTKVNYDELRAEKKWRPYLHQEHQRRLANLVPIGKYCRIARGIATGANSFFCLSQQEAEALDIGREYLRPCLCRSRDVHGNMWRQEDWQKLSDSQSKAYILDVQQKNISKAVAEYIRYGEKIGIASRYLVSQRKPWYSMEQKPIAPIFISSAYRNEYKVLRNLAQTANLTTFHSIYINDLYKDYRDIIFCYLLTNTARELISRNRKELGRGLKKLQPGDLQQAEMLDIELLTQDSCAKIMSIYTKILMNEDFSANLTDELENIFQPYYN